MWQTTTKNTKTSGKSSQSPTLQPKKLNPSIYTKKNLVDFDPGARKIIFHLEVNFIPFNLPTHIKWKIKKQLNKILLGLLPHFQPSQTSFTRKLNFIPMTKNKTTHPLKNSCILGGLASYTRTYLYIIISYFIYYYIL